MTKKKQPVYTPESCGCIKRDGKVVVWCGTWARDFRRLLDSEDR